MRKKVQLKVDAEDRQIWFILDDAGVLLSGPGVEMVQAFCHLTGQSTYTLTATQLKEYDLPWEGTLRLLQQRSMFQSAEHDTIQKSNKRRKKLQKAAEAFSLDEDFFD